MSKGIVNQCCCVFVENETICDCSCHTDKNAMHIRACCSKCKLCGKYISRGFENSHAKTHHTNDGKKL